MNLKSARPEVGREKVQSAEDLVTRDLTRAFLAPVAKNDLGASTSTHGLFRGRGGGTL